MIGEIIIVFIISVPICIYYCGYGSSKGITATIFRYVVSAKLPKHIKLNNHTDPLLEKCTKHCKVIAILQIIANSIAILVAVLFQDYLGLIIIVSLILLPFKVSCLVGVIHQRAKIIFCVLHLNLY